jgi:hypothetical protein
VALPRKERQHRQKLGALLRDAGANGFARLRAETGVFYCAVRNPADLDQLVTRMRKPDYLFIPLIGDTLLPQYEPLAWNIRDSEHWWSVVTGRLHIIVLVDRRVVASLFRRKGFEVEWLDDDQHLGAGWRVTSPQLPGRHFDVAYQFFARVGTEFVDLNWSVEAVTARFRQVMERATEHES